MITLLLVEVEELLPLLSCNVAYCCGRIMSCSKILVYHSTADCSSADMTFYCFCLMPPLAA